MRDPVGISLHKELCCSKSENLVEILAQNLTIVYSIVYTALKVRGDIDALALYLPPNIKVVNQMFCFILSRMNLFLVQDSNEDIENNIESIENVEIISNIDQECLEEPELSREFLEALGEPKESEKRFGTPINMNILKRFENILIEGIRTEEKEKIVKDLCFPEKGKLMQAPKLNIELTGLLTSAMKLRDKMLEERQEDTGYVIATLCHTIDMMTKPDFDNLTIVKNLSDATRLLCNLHYKYTDIRRKLISPLLDKNLDFNLKDNKRSEWLYSKLDDAVKSVSAMKKASSILAPPKKTKNWQPPPRQQSHFHRGKGVARGGYQHQLQYQSRPPPRQGQQQGRRPAPAPSSSQRMTRGRSRYP